MLLYISVEAGGKRFNIKKVLHLPKFNENFLIIFVDYHNRSFNLKKEKVRGIRNSLL